VNASPPSATLSRIDRLGVCLSLACAVQCLARPLLFTVLAAAAAMILLGQLVLDESYELAFVVIGTAILAGGHLLNRALCRACRRCQDEDTHAAG
jgi:hypothetical protein